MALTLTHTTGEWDGTFALTAEFLIRDLLSDDAPFAAAIVHQPNGGPEQTVTGLVTQLGSGSFWIRPYAGQGLDHAPALIVETDELVSIEVP